MLILVLEKVRCVQELCGNTIRRELQVFISKIKFSQNDVDILMGNHAFLLMTWLKRFKLLVLLEMNAQMVNSSYVLELTQEELKGSNQQLRDRRNTLMQELT